MNVSWNLYNKNLDLINIYACSESGFAVGFFKIDKAYETCPIGRPQVETTIVLLGEDGKETAEGETGELCFVNPYVRGYINLPEETEKAFRGGLYHTGDLARIDENGNYVLLGRSGDMIKINGNRIEPATLREELMKRLPYYMIPAYFMKIDSIPLKGSGKLDRQALPVPDVKDFQSSYVAPANETEQAVCDAMAQVLGLRFRLQVCAFCFFSHRKWRLRKKRWKSHM